MIPLFAGPVTLIRIDPETLDDSAACTAAEAGWREASRNIEIHAGAQVAAAHQYVRSIDAYIAVLNAAGRPVPHRLDDMAHTLRVSYGEPPALHVN